MGIYVEDVFLLSQLYFTFCEYQFAVVEQTENMTGNSRKSCIKFKKFRSSSAHRNLREMVKLKFTGISKVDLSFQLTII